MITPEQVLLMLTDRKRAYQAAFGTPAGQTVLDDLAVFCRARETCVIPGDRDRTFVLEGRRETYLRIRDHLDLSPEQLVEQYTRPAKGAYGHDDQDRIPA